MIVYDYLHIMIFKGQSSKLRDICQSALSFFGCLHTTGEAIQRRFEYTLYAIVTTSIFNNRIGPTSPKQVRGSEKSYPDPDM